MVPKNPDKPRYDQGPNLVRSGFLQIGPSRGLGRSAMAGKRFRRAVGGNSHEAIKESFEAITIRPEGGDANRQST